ncbi:unnamed protein product [Colias eurytheme]|nr:unnamed protein product [Colias eurytheme]
MNETEEEQGAIVKFTLMPPKFRLHRDVIFSLDDLIASLGGTTALFVGASVLTVVETALFIIRYTISYIMDKRHQNTLDFKH